MELRSSFCAALLIFILLSASSCLTAGRLHGEEGMEELSEIDYRGPETHSSSFPPPGHSHHGSQWTRRTVTGEPTSDDKTIKAEHNIGKIHG